MLRHVYRGGSIKNTPRFWREKKGELIAMMDNFGPFHWFFTLSLADKRWKEILAAICMDFPGVERIVYSKDRDGSNIIKVKVHGRDEEMDLKVDELHRVCSHLLINLFPSHLLIAIGPLSLIALQG